MLGLLGSVAAIESILLLCLVSRLPPISRAAGSCVGIFVLGKGRALSRFLVFYLSLSFASAVYRMRSPSGIDLHYQRALATLSGSCLFVAIVIRQVHAIVFEDEPLRKSFQKIKLRLEITEAEKSHKQEQCDRLETTVAGLRVKLEKMKLDCAAKDDAINELMAKLENLKIDAESRTKELRAAEASVQALKKQGEGFLLEYDRLLEDNGHLRSQLAYFDRKYSGTELKKKS